MPILHNVITNHSQLIKIKVIKIRTVCHTIQLHSLRRKPKIQSHDWISRDIKSYLLINMKKMTKHVAGGRTSERDKIGKKWWTSDAKKRKKGRNMILFTSCKGPSLGRVWQFPHRLTTNNIIIWRKTDVSCGTGICLNKIFNLNIACVKCMCIRSGIYSRG